MRTLKIALLASVATAAFSSATLAADLIIDTAPVMVDNSYGFDWDGPYAGLWVGGLTNPAVFALGADFGVNALVDSSLLVGVEGNLSYESNTTWSAQAHGRLGFVADSAVIYGLVGIGWNSGSGTYVPIGAGVEFAVAENLSLKAEYNYQWDISAPAASSRHVGKVGFNFHF